MNNFLLAPTKRKLRPNVDFEKSLAKLCQMELTPAEQKFYDALCLVDITGDYGRIILEIFTNFSIEKFRELVCELLQQREDASYAVYKMLGKNAYDCLLDLKRSL